jgi:hypothetical protein
MITGQRLIRHLRLAPRFGGIGSPLVGLCRLGRVLSGIEVWLPPGGRSANGKPSGVAAQLKIDESAANGTTGTCRLAVCGLASLRHVG